MANAAKSRSKTRIQREKTEEILAAALEVFSQNGFRGSTINSIAAKTGMSTPSILYYFKDKEDIHQELLTRTLLLWIGPLNLMKESADPVEEICQYVRRKLEISENFPRESRLFANAILVGVPRGREQIFDPLKSVFNAKIILIEQWIKAGKIARVDPHHLLYSIWATTQHYADFEAQIDELSHQPQIQLYKAADVHLTTMFTRFLSI